MTTQSCMVIGCLYAADSAIDDFVVCGLHDSPKVRALLEEGHRVGSYWYRDVPIVLPCGELEEADLEPRFSEDAAKAEDCPRLLEALELGPGRCHPRFDLFLD